VRYGGNTSCVTIKGSGGTWLVLDAGTGIRNFSLNLPENLKRVDILLTHLHMDHLQGLPFFDPLRNPEIETHIWGPASTTMGLMSRLQRYVSPPLFPVSVRDLSTRLQFHELTTGIFEIGEFKISAQLVIHPNPTVGYRIIDAERVVSYLPDHEPMLGAMQFPGSPEWTSGYAIAEAADLLIHDTQYTDEEYRTRTGFGHSNITHAFQFAELTGAKKLIPFHHDPAHSDDQLDKMIAQVMDTLSPNFDMVPGMEGMTFQV
jgi:ribonuclease BN (tRNA processing enzyme)